MKNSKCSRLDWTLVIALAAITLFSRYGGWPFTVIAADDWTNFAHCLTYPSDAAAAHAALQDPRRPLSMLVVEVVFRWVAKAPGWLSIVGWLGNVTLVLLVAAITRRLTGQRLAAFIAGLSFALWPNLTETYNWSTQVVNEVACGLIPYAASAVFVIRYFDSNQKKYLLLSTAFYAVGLFSYEAGLFLPGAFLVLALLKGRGFRGLLQMIPFGVMAATYAVWRTTNAFGLNTTWNYPPHMDAGVSFFGVLYNTKDLALWWVGDRLAGAVLSGWNGFATMTPWCRRILILGDVLACVWMAVLIRRSAREDAATDTPNKFSRLQAFAFGAVWLGCAALPVLMAYSPSRLNVLPAIGVSIMAGVFMSQWPSAKWKTMCVVLGFVCLVSNQGTSRHWRDAGIFLDRIYVHMREHRAEWADKEIVLLDTASMRQRNTAGLLPPLTNYLYTWDSYGNACLLRGFVPRGMVELILSHQETKPMALLDVEYGADISGNELKWHDRFDPAAAHVTPLDRVYVVDAFDAGSSPLTQADVPCPFSGRRLP